MKKNHYILTFLFLFSYFIHIQGIIIRTTVMGNSEDQEIVLYGDQHFRQDQQRVDFQNNCLKSRLEKLFEKDSQTEIFYEGLSTVNNNVIKLDGDTTKKETLFVIEEVCKLKPQQCLNIDPRSYVTSIQRMFTYLVFPNIDDQNIYTFNYESELIRKKMRLDYDRYLKFLNEWKIYVNANREYLMQPISSILDEINKLYSSLKSDIECFENVNIKELLLKELQKVNIENSQILKAINFFSPGKTILEIKKECPITFDKSSFLTFSQILLEGFIFLDIYAIIQVLKSKSQKIILFAGLAHTENLKNILQKLGYWIQYESEIKDKDFNNCSYEELLGLLGNYNFDFQPIKITDLKYIS